jgi:8-oxo-dGTP pyrophosphatase MutT (NUDIX family)
MLEKMRGRKPTLIDMESYRRSAVVIPLIETPEGYEVLFEVRAVGLKHQPGEICFPGGGCDKGEAPEAAARREICEELLIMPEQIELEAPMDIFISPFNMIIYPYLGTLKDYTETFSEDEVLEVFTVPLNFFMETEPKIYYNKIYTEPPEDFPWDKVQNGYKYHWNTGRYPVVFYEHNGRIIWGITARIMRSAVQQMQAAGWRK